MRRCANGGCSRRARLPDRRLHDPSGDASLRRQMCQMPGLRAHRNSNRGNATTAERLDATFDPFIALARNLFVALGLAILGQGGFDIVEMGLDCDA